MNLVRKFPEGIHAAEVRDAYPAAMADVEALRQEGRVWALPHPDTGLPQSSFADSCRVCSSALNSGNGLTMIVANPESSPMCLATSFLDFHYY
jgi:hypothetical protein